VTRADASPVCADRDEPTVDEAMSPPAGPSSPPPRRRKRQEDLLASHVPALGQPIGSEGNQTRTTTYPRDLMDDENGTFPADQDMDDNGEERDLEDEEDPVSYRALQEQMYSGPTDFIHTSRSYDDEDAALQAALKASMDDLPADWVSKPKPTERVSKKTSPKKAAPAPPPIETKQPAPVQAVTSSGAAGSKFKEELEVDDEDVQTEPLSAGSYCCHFCDE